MSCDFWTFLWFSQLVDDGSYLSGRKRLAGGFVACLLQLFPKLGAVGKVHQGQFFFAVCFYRKLIHGRPPFS